MKIAHTRAMINAALSGALDDVSYQRDPIFNLDVPDVAARTCRPKCSSRATRGRTRRPTTRRPQKLAKMFVDNFKTLRSDRVPEVKQRARDVQRQSAIG